jgi:hypothetical protein
VKTKRLLTILAALAACAALLAACGGDDDDGGSGPEPVATDWLEAVKDKDYEGACEFMDPAGFTDDKQCSLAMKLIGDRVSDDSKIGEVTDDGSTAEVVVTGGPGEDYILLMAEAEGEWLIGAINASSTTVPVPEPQ